MKKSARCRLDKRATVRRRTLSDGGLLDDETTWKDVIRRWPCRIRPIASSERVYFHRHGAEVTHRIYGAAPADIRPQDRLTVAGRTFEVDGPPRDLDEANEILVFTAREKT